MHSLTTEIDIELTCQSENIAFGHTVEIDIKVTCDCIVHVRFFVSNRNRIAL